MTKTPEKFTTTREFSDTLRWMRERVLKLSIAELADTDRKKRSAADPGF